MKSRLVTEPIYQQLGSLLREMIQRGAFRAGEKFLTEREICERFGVSRATANKAVSNLVSQGLLTFRKGVGTFVRDGVLDYELSRLVSFTDKARAAGMKPSTKVLAFRRLKASRIEDEIAAALRLNRNDEVYFMERLRLADDEPVIMERRYVVAALCPKLTKRMVGESLYRLWRERYRLEISGARQTIRAVAIRGKDARLLKVSSGSPGLLVTGVGFVRGNIPLWHENTLYRGDRYEFRNRFGPLLSIAVGGLIVGKSKGKE